MNSDGLAARGKQIAESGKYRPTPDVSDDDMRGMLAAMADAKQHHVPDEPQGVADLPHLGPEPETRRSDTVRSAQGIDGPALLDELRDTFIRYVAFQDEHSADAVTLWTAATHAVDAFECAPRLVFTSPQKRCGKSRVLDIVSGTCHKPLAYINASVAAIFRSIGGEHPPTLIIDEADTIFGSKKVAEQNEDMRALLNAGHQRGRPALRCVGPNQIPTEFKTFAFAALAGIGNMPDTITDRAVNIGMRRRTAGEKVSQFRSRRDGPKLKALRDQIAEWAATHLDKLTQAEPDMPVLDRAADTWEPLVALADVVGGHWPETARAACTALVDGADADDEDDSLAVKLLVDIKHVFTDKGVSFLSSADLVAELRRVEESPWGEFELNPSKLAYRLKDFDVKPRRNPAGNTRGYALEMFSDTFERYTRQNPSETSEPQAKHHFASDGQDRSDGLGCQTDLPVRQESASQQSFLTGLTPSDDPPAETGSTPPGFTPPSGPGRCDQCGYHIEKQGHRDDCTANERTTK